MTEIHHLGLMSMLWACGLHADLCTERLSENGEQLEPRKPSVLLQHTWS